MQHSLKPFSKQFLFKDLIGEQSAVAYSIYNNPLLNVAFSIIENKIVTNFSKCLTFYIQNILFNKIKY